MPDYLRLPDRAADGPVVGFNAFVDGAQVMMEFARELLEEAHVVSKANEELNLARDRYTTLYGPE